MGPSLALRSKGKTYMLTRHTAFFLTSWFSPATVSDADRLFQKSGFGKVCVDLLGMVCVRVSIFRKKREIKYI